MRCRGSGGGGRPRSPAQVDDDLVEVDAHLDPPADEAGVAPSSRWCRPARSDPAASRVAEPPRRVGQHRREAPSSRRGPRQIASAGRHRSVRVDPLVRPAQPAGQLGVEVGDVVEAPARQEARLQVAVGPLDEALGLGIGRAAQIARPCRACPGTPGTRAVRTWRPWRQAPMQPSLSYTALRGTAAELSRDLRACRPACRAPAATGSSSAPMQPRVARHADDHPQLVGLAVTRPGSSTAGSHRSHWASSPGRYSVRWHGSGGTNNGRSSAHPVPQDRDRPRPSRSARRSPSPASAGTRPATPGSAGSTASTADARRRALDTRGGPSERSAVAHRVASHAQPARDLLDRPSPRPDAADGSRPSPPRRSPSFLPGSQSEPGSEFHTSSGGPDQKGVSFRPVIGGQFSAGGDKPLANRRSGVSSTIDPGAPRFGDLGRWVLASRRATSTRSVLAVSGPVGSLASGSASLGSTGCRQCPLVEVSASARYARIVGTSVLSAGAIRVRARVIPRVVVNTTAAGNGGSPSRLPVCSARRRVRGSRSRARRAPAGDGGSSGSRRRHPLRLHRPRPGGRW